MNVQRQGRLERKIPRFYHQIMSMSSKICVLLCFCYQVNGFFDKLMDSKLGLVLFNKGLGFVHSSVCCRNNEFTCTHAAAQIIYNYVMLLMVKQLLWVCILQLTYLAGKRSMYEIYAATQTLSLRDVCCSLILRYQLILA